MIREKFIYIIVNEDNNRFKIGFSKNPLSRLKSLQTGNDGKLTIYYQRKVKHYSKIESYLKLKFIEYQTIGEWYDHQISFSEIDDIIYKCEKMYKCLNKSYI